MTIQNERELNTTRQKLAEMEQQLADAKHRLNADTPLSEWTLRSLRKLVQQLREEVIRYESHAADVVRN